ncbi:MAG TPA: hypothetical protein VMX18_01240 [Candidatus Bipolaricaulota bacterium]|nr:hypothetical protein [Candidatus Bipolaricaulota bacterium]
MKITPQQFKDYLQKMSGTPYLPEAVLSAISKKGYSEYLSYSCDRDKAVKIAAELQAEGVIPKYKSPGDVMTAIEKE